MVQNIGHNRPNARRRGQRFLCINSSDLLVLAIFLLLHRVDVVNAEWQHIAIVDGVHNGVAVQLLAKGLRRGFQHRVAPGA